MLQRLSVTDNGDSPLELDGNDAQNAIIVESAEAAQKIGEFSDPFRLGYNKVTCRLLLVTNH